MESNKEVGRPRSHRFNMSRMKNALKQIIRCCDATAGGHLEDMDVILQDIKREAQKGLDTMPIPKQKVIISHVKKLKL